MADPGMTGLALVRSTWIGLVDLAQLLRGTDEQKHQLTARRGGGGDGRDGEGSRKVKEKAREQWPGWWHCERC
ncbi:hypothetical protein B296_00055823 [Ensete ventricosum]|uniref:Uncharacterized protein n=1 Tax=Ensete ventricosum TaxID=4639 RepID=A0A426X1K0_ENSVE|nr:hypothetical protein B296_00055823 [Ensete ventricosum]